MDIERRIYAIIETIKPGSTAALKADQDLFAAGILDSFGMLEYISALEDEFALRIPNEDLIPQNLWNVAATRKTVESHLP